MSDLATDDEHNNSNHTGMGTKRKANRSNPQISYAYGAPSDGKQPAKRPRGSKELSVELDTSTSPSAPEIISPEKADAVNRYKAIRERQQQRQLSPLKKGEAASTSKVESPRRSARLSATGSQDGTSLYERNKAITAIEEDQAVEEEEEEEQGEMASSSASQQRRKRALSPGQSRSMGTHLTSFYLDASGSRSDIDSSVGLNGLPTSLLRGSQRRPHQSILAEGLGPGLDSIHSSDLGDSGPRDYAEEERYAQMLEESRQNGSGASSWLKSLGQGRGGEKNAEGETSMERRRKKGRVSGDNREYKPVSEEQTESDSGTSVEGRKHSHRKKKVDTTKSDSRGGRDDKKIWMTKARRRGAKRHTTNGEGDENAEQGLESADEVLSEKNQVSEEQKDASQASVKRSPSKAHPRVNKHRVSSSRRGLHISLWALLLGVLLVLGGMQWRARGLRSVDFESISDFISSHPEPKSLTEASKRIVKLENAIDQLRIAGNNFAKEGKGLISRIATLEVDNGKAAERMASTQSALQAQMRMIEERAELVRPELAKLQRRLDEEHINSKASETANSAAMRMQIERLEMQIKAADKQLGQVTERMAAAEKMAKQTKENLSWLEKKLPAEIAVPFKPTSGKASLDANTWQNLRNIFISREDSDFQRKNEEAIRTISLETIETKIKSGVVMDRQSFLKLLQSELEQVKTSMEARFNANAGEMQNDILAKVRAQQDMYEQAGSRKRPQGQTAPDLSRFDISTKDGSDAKSAIVALIDAALEIYSADRIARRDFALYSAGGRVIPSLTSPTYKLSTRSYFSWTGKKMEASKPPVVALHHDSSPGMCWAFHGEDGQLGIGLARKIIVSDVTLEHVPASISLEAGSSAPRDVTVWGLVERKEDRKRLAAHRLALERASGDDTLDDVAKPAPPSMHHIMLASFTYDIHSSRAIQTFPASHEAKLLEIPISIVQVRVTSNHGNKDFTCLYRIRMHGREWTWDDEQGE